MNQVIKDAYDAYCAASVALVTAVDDITDEECAEYEDLNDQRAKDASPAIVAAFVVESRLMQEEEEAAL